MARRSSDGKLGKIYNFPNLKKKEELTCTDCEYVMMGSSGLYCSFYKEELMSEISADECEEFTPSPWAKDRK